MKDYFEENTFKYDFKIVIVEKDSKEKMFYGFKT